MRSRSKYPNLGIVDALSKLVLGFSIDVSRQGLYEVLPYRPSRTEYSRSLDSLTRNGYIKIKGQHVTITKKGKKKAHMRSIEQISLSKQSDGKYRLIAFDIPEKMRHARDIIRSKLKAFECEKIQKSIYMTPYICEDEIQEICAILKIERYVTVLKLDRSNFSRFNDRINQRTHL